MKTRQRFPRMLCVLATILAVLAACPAEVAPAGDWADATRDYTGALPVFPGAEGFGTDTAAGRGGAVIRVTSLDAQGPGTLQEALAASGPRTIVFEVGGVIDTANALVIEEPCVTVAGQTAPPPGITIIGAGLLIRTHDVLLQHLRVRPGDRPDGPVPDARDAISILGPGENGPPTERVVVDHCSFSWAIDKGSSTWGADVRDVTFRQCIIAENLSRSLHPEGEHSKGMLIGDHARRVSVIGNLFASNMQRSPLIKGGVSALVANNLIFNPGEAAIHFSDPEGSGPSLASLLGNVLLPGKNTPLWMSLVQFYPDVKKGSKVFMADNSAAKRVDVVYLNPWRWVTGFVQHKGTPPVQLTPLTVLPASSVEAWVLDNAGARPAKRDADDARVVQDVRTRTGRIIDNVAQAGGFPPLNPVTRPLTLPEDPTADADNDGYTNLEEYLHQKNAEVTPPAAP